MTFKDEKAAQAPVVKEEPKPRVVNWDEAEKVEAAVTFMNRGDFIFVNFHLKGYKKEDVKYALSKDEIFLEVKDQQKVQVHKICQTLWKKIVLYESQV